VKAGRISVWVAEAYDDGSWVIGVYDSLNAAVVGIKADYPPPYKVEWQAPEQEETYPAAVRWWLMGRFKAVAGYSTKHTASFSITEWPVESSRS
jgi:hypothetical protein